jgi:hypothetical protein
MDDKTALLRHTLATLAYRGGKAFRGAPPEFAHFTGATRTPSRILAHIGDLLDWALAMANGRKDWQDSPAAEWDAGTARFFAALEALDARLAAAEPPAVSPEKLFQGPIADALTHVGQIAMLRRMAGCPFRGENYFVADMAVGRVGSEQAPPRVEFD